MTVLDMQIVDRRLEELIVGTDATVTLIDAGQELAMHSSTERSAVALISCGDVAQKVIDGVGELIDEGLEGPHELVCDHADPGDIRTLVAVGASGVVQRDEAMVTLIPTPDASKAPAHAAPRPLPIQRCGLSPTT